MRGVVFTGERGLELMPFPDPTPDAHDVVIEMKWIGELPNWAEELHGYLRERAPADRPSKFVVAMRHLLGEAKKS